ncbi:MAG TPA: hypothetical protein VGA45_21250, partial [Actinomycetota bacterium]
GGHERTGGHPPQANGYDSGGYPSSAGYGQAGYEGGYPPAGGYGSGTGYGAADQQAGGDRFATGDQYGTGAGGYGRTDPGSSDPGLRPGASGSPGPGQPDATPPPRHDPFAAYGLQNARRTANPGGGTQAAGSGPRTGPIGTGASSGPRSGPIGAGSAGGPRSGPIGSGPIGAGASAGSVWPAPDSTWPPGSGASTRAGGSPPRPETWPPQTPAAWQLDQSPPRQTAASGEFPRVLDEDEQVIRLGRTIDEQSGRGAMGRDRSTDARTFDDDGEHISQRARWPKVVALISWIILLMVLCWFYVFPWLEKILPENF